MSILLAILLVIENLLLAYKYRKKIKVIFEQTNIHKYNEEIPQFQDEKNAWYSNEVKLILHGAGGIKGGRYNNSKEGIEAGILNGYKVIEIDIGVTSDNVFVLTHRFEPDDEIIFDHKPSLDEFLNRGALEGETPITLEQFIRTYCNYSSNIYWIIDCAHGIEKEVAQWLSKNVDSIKRNKLIFQVHGSDLLEEVASMNTFDHIHYNGEIQEIRGMIPDFYAYNVHTCSISDREISKHDEDLLFIIKSGVHVYSYTVNHNRRLTYDLECGVTGVFTDTLLPN